MLHFVLHFGKNRCILCKYSLRYEKKRNSENRDIQGK
nr:MAG TPA: hypothetical protein [Podoviridae sp. ctJ6o53]